MENQFSKCIEEMNTTLMLINIKLQEMDRRVSEIEEIVIRDQMDKSGSSLPDEEIRDMQKTLSGDII